MNCCRRKYIDWSDTRIKYRYFSWIVSLLFFSISDNLKAQQNFSLTGGWGLYELTNVGVQWNYSKKSSLSLYGGTNFGLNKNTLWSAGLSFDQVFLKPAKWKIKPGYSVGAVYWIQEDELYNFKTISLPIMALLAYPISPLLTARVESGVAFSQVLLSDRKQNIQAGFPKRINGNFRINIIYKLKTK